MKKFYSRLLLIVFFCISYFAMYSQTVINPLVSSSNPKLHFGLSELVRLNSTNTNFNETNVANFSLLAFKNNNTKVKVDVISKGNGDILYEELTKLGIEIIARQQNFITCWAEISQINTYLSRAPSIVTMRSWLKPMNNSGPVLSQGDAAQRSNLARVLGVNGTGVKVGVLSDSYNNLGGANAGVTAGELPGNTNPQGFITPITVLSDIASGGTDEGRAMIEIVHDVAPGAQLYFYTAFNSEADFAAGIRALADAGCKVIIDDVFYFDEPFFQDGIVAQAVDYAVNVKGATYFSSAGNQANQSYEAPFQASTYEPIAGETAHNFGTADAPIYFLPIRATSTNGFRLGFQWDEPYLSAGNESPGSASDLNIYIANFNSTTNVYTLAAGSFGDNINQDPFEFTSLSGVATRYILITKKSGPDPTRIRFTNFSGVNWTTSTPPTVVGIKAGANAGHSNSVGAIACAAASYDKTPAFGVNPPTVESFSSKGGTKIMFSKFGVRLPAPVDRFKPEITAPDNANTSFFFAGYDYEPDGKPNFAGTSAAAPHAGAVAALMLQGNPLLTPAQIKTALINSCTDMDDPTTDGFDTGFDYGTGNGLIKADAAVQATINPNCASAVITTTRSTTFCQGDSVIFNASIGTDYTYQWRKNGVNISGANQAQYIARVSGNYSVTITHLECTVYSEPITVVTNVGTLPPNTISKAILLGTTITEGNGLQASGTCLDSSPSTITWWDAISGGTQVGTGIEFIPTNTAVGVYTYYAQVSCNGGVGCNTSVRKAATLTITDVPVATGANLCLGYSVNLTATGCLGVGLVLKWYQTADNVEIIMPVSPTISTQYYAKCQQTIDATVTLSGKSNDVTVTVNPVTGVTPSAGSNSPICAGNTLNLTSDGGTSYAWTGPNSFSSSLQNPTIANATITATGTYSVVVTNENGCTAMATVEVTVNPIPTATASSNSPICSGVTLNLAASGGEFYAWTGPNSFTSTDQNPSIALTTSAALGVYTVTVSSSGCFATATTIVSLSNAPARLYVSRTANGADTGLSWADAYPSLQAALNYACNNNLTEIWVAKGTYKPASFNGNQTLSFNIPSGVKVYGGFAGTENSLIDRDLTLIHTTNLTTLNGDLNGNDGVNFANITDNSFNVVKFSNATPSTLLEGFTISGGNGYNAGGGVSNGAESSPQIVNCIIKNNAATGTSLDQQSTTLSTSGVGITVTTYGGQTFTPAISGLLTKADVNLFCSSCTGTTPNLILSVRQTSGGLPTGADLATATITGFSSGAGGYFSAIFNTPANLTAGTVYALVIHPVSNPSAGIYAFTRSTASVYAGGMRVSSSNSGSTWSSTTNDAGFHVYISNPAIANGGGINNNGTLSLINSLVIGNAANSGGAIYNSHNLTITNSTFSGNISPNGGGAIANNGESSVVMLTNNVFFGNTNSFANAGGNLTASYSLFDDMTNVTDAGNNLSTVAAPFISSTDFHLNCGSNAINKGNNAATGLIGITKDIEGNARIYNSELVDMGAYEFQGSLVYNANNNSPICEGTTLTLTSNNGGTYAWSGPNSFTSTEQNPTIVESSTAASGIYTLIVTINGGCTTSATTSVIVNALPIATASSNSPICA
ncbi:MAG: S8 family serine peptidase, partial [Bacteroidota bacterium]